MTADPTGHVIVCGLHDEGLRVVEQLVAAGAAVVVVDADPDPHLARELAGQQLRLLSLDAREASSLTEAGIERARALVCVEDDDLRGLAVALLARELRPDLRVVVQLRNVAVGRALAETGIVVLDVAALSAPSFAEACVGGGRRTLRMGSHAFGVVQTAVTETGTLRARYGDLAPLAVVLADGSVEVSPGRDTEVAAGDRVALIGEPDELRRRGLTSSGPRPEYIGARAGRRSRPRPMAWGRFLLKTVDTRITITLAALTGLLVVSVTVLMSGYQEPGGRRMGVLDALYFTVETIGTVGYGDFYFRNQPDWLRAWAIGLMAVGATLATVGFALITNALLSRTLARSFGDRRITALSEHVIVVGLGSVGLALVRELRSRGIDVVVVEIDEHDHYLPELRALKVPFVVADATLPETWVSTRLPQARAVAVMTSDDLISIETGLAARHALGARWGDVPVALRVFEQRLAATVASSFDFRNVRSPAALAAPWFVGAALGIDVLQTFYVGGLPLLVVRLEVAAGSALDGVAMRDLSARIRVVVLRRANGSEELRPRRGHRLAGGDAAHLIGPYDELLVLLRENSVPAPEMPDAR